MRQRSSRGLAVALALAATFTSRVAAAAPPEASTDAVASPGPLPPLPAGPTPSAPSRSSAPEIVFPNAQPAPLAIAPPPDHPQAPKPPREPVRLAVGPSVLAASMGRLAVLGLVGEVPIARGFGIRGWFDVPLASKSLDERGGVSAASVWMGGLGFARTFGDRGDRVRPRLHAGWGATVLHERPVSAESSSGLTLTRKPEDLFTLFGQVGIEAAVRVVGPVSLVGGARAGTLLSRLVVEHGPGREAGVFGPQFAALDVRLEVQP